MGKQSAVLDPKEERIAHNRSFHSPGFGARLLRQRQRAGMSQEDLATLAGITRAHVSYLEHGKGGTAMATLERLAKALKTTPTYLLFGSRKTRRGGSL